MRILIFLLYCLFFPLRTFAQSQPILDQNPARLRWLQINTPKFQVIFPEGFEREAQRTANTLQTIYQPVSGTLQKEPRKLSVILQNQTAVSNGFVTITPRRSEFFTLPPQDYSLLGTNDWINLLAVHEYRHVVQYDKALTGFSKAVYYVLGGNGLSLITGLSVPGWFWEGDAVGTETALTGSGRGRIPAFDLDLRTFLLTKGAFTYPKAYLSSYKDYVTANYSRYKLGYFMTTYARRKYGVEAWSHILNRTYNFPLVPFRFSGALKKETGLRVEDLYRNTMQEMDSLWRNQLKDLPVTEAAPLPTARNRVFTNYQYPQFLSGGRIFAQKTGLATIETYVALGDSAKEEKLFVPGFTNNSGMLSVVNDVVVWSEQAYDPRWGIRDYTVIKTYDFRNKKLRQLTHRSRLSAPALSPDGKRIVAVQVSESNQYTLVILNTQTGAEIGRLSNPENHFYLTPRWSPDGAQVVAVKLMPKGKTIESIHVATGEKRNLLPVTQLNLAHPVWHGAYVYFNSPYSGIDNIYAVHVATGEQFQVTSRPFGAYNPAISPDGSLLAYNDFTENGFRVVTAPNNPAAWMPIAQVENRTVAYYEPLLQQEGNQNVLENVPEKRYPVNRYGKLAHALNPYSWSPLLSSSGDALTVSLLSQDLLSTALANVGFGYNANERTGSLFANLSYQGLYPVLDVEFESGQRRAGVYVDRQRPLDSLVRDQWNERIISGGVRLPFNLTHSKYSQRINLSAFASVREISSRLFENWNGTLQAMRYGFTYQRFLKRALRDVNPRWGQTAAVYFRHTPFGGDFNARLFAAEGNLFFPGLLKHHSLRLRAGYQRESSDVYRFSSPLFFPRGYSYTSYDEFYNGSVEYALPLFNPDWTIGRWLYVKRFKSTGFFDYGRGKTDERAVHYQSVGLDVTTEFHFMRLDVPLELGIRTIYLPQTKDWQFQSLVVNVGF